MLAGGDNLGRLRGKRRRVRCPAEVVVAQRASGWPGELVWSSSDRSGSTGALAGGDPQIGALADGDPQIIVTILLMTGSLPYRPECASLLFPVAAKGSSCKIVACPGGAASAEQEAKTDRKGPSQPKGSAAAIITDTARRATNPGTTNRYTTR
jgi:hypothetical protein